MNEHRVFAGWVNEKITASATSSGSMKVLRFLSSCVRLVPKACSVLTPPGAIYTNLDSQIVDLPLQGLGKSKLSVLGSAVGGLAQVPVQKRIPMQ